MSDLHDAAEAPSGLLSPPPSLERVRAVLDSGADVNALDALGRTPLESAALHSGYEVFEAPCLAVMQLLISRGARAASAPNVHTPIAHFLLLLDNGAPVSALNEQREQAIHCAAHAGRAQHLAALLARGADVNAIDGLGRTPLWRAKQSGDGESIELLVRAGGVERATLPPRDDPFAPIALPAGLGDAVSVQALLDTLWSREPGAQRAELCRVVSSKLPRRDVVLPGGSAPSLPLFVNGDLTVEGHFTMLRPLMVSGSVHVKGVWRDASPTVLGDATCAVLYGGDGLDLGGTLATELVLCSGREDPMTARTLRAVALVTGGFALPSERRVGVEVSAENASELKLFVEPTSLEGAEWFDSFGLARRISAGERAYAWPSLDVSTPDAVARLLTWFASKLTHAPSASRFMRALMQRELGVDAAKLAVAIDHALSAERVAEHREFLAAIG